MLAKGGFSIYMQPGHFTFMLQINLTSDQVFLSSDRSLSLGLWPSHHWRARNKWQDVCSMASGQSTLPSCYFRSHYSFLVKGGLQNSFDNLSPPVRKGKAKSYGWCSLIKSMLLMSLLFSDCVNQARKMNRHEHFFWQVFERINIAVRRKGGGELVTADSLFTILLSRAQKSVQAAVEEQQHDDHL